MRWFVLAIAVVGVGACDGDGKETDPPPPPGTSGDCGENPPVITDVWVEDGGMYQFEQDQIFPSVLIWADVEDEDKDLNYYSMRVWFDEVIDGRVLAEGDYAETQGTLSSEDCSVPSAQVGLRLAVTSSQYSPNFSVETEFGVVVYDDEDNPSNDEEPLEADAFFTPDENGEYPE